MKAAVAAVCTALLLAGCLEIDQHPGWRQGEYADKPDNLPEQANFNGDRLAWIAVISNRNQWQNEYNRTTP
jgi:hypothetical protein